MFSFEIFKSGKQHHRHKEVSIPFSRIRPCHNVFGQTQECFAAQCFL